MRIDERIEERYAELSPQEQKAADTLLDRLGDIAVYNAVELAQLSGVSKATMSRLFRRLGFSDFNEVKEHARSIRSSGMPVGPRLSDSGLDAHLVQEQDNLRRLGESLDEERLAITAAALAHAPTVLLLGFRNSFPLALHLRQQLLQCRASVHVAPQPGQSLGEELAGLGKDDAVVLFGFRRRPADFQGILKAASATGASTVLIGDSSARRLASDASLWIECPIEGAHAFDSYGAAMSLISVLASGVLNSLGKAGRDRVRDVSGMFDSLGEIEG